MAGCTAPKFLRLFYDNREDETQPGNLQSVQWPANAFSFPPLVHNKNRGFLLGGTTESSQEFVGHKTAEAALLTDAIYCPAGLRNCLALSDKALLRAR